MMKTAILLCSMGGPDSLAAVRPFLFNLFNDPAILRLPQPLRGALAWLISTTRAPHAKTIYDRMGGSSPIVANTLEQAESLEKELRKNGDYSCFVGMSYWHPFIADTMREIIDLDPDRVIVIPLYPQYSTTTTASVLRDAQKAARKQGLRGTMFALESFQVDEGFIAAQAALIQEQWKEAQQYGTPRLLFSAHGLPQQIVDAGDPYPDHCAQTVAALVKALDIPDLDYTLCYQSKVGRMAWIGPATDVLVKQTAQDKRPIVIAPIAFVSEHAETLVELDQDYKKLADEYGSPFYAVARTVSSHPSFIQNLARQIQKINQNIANKEEK